MGSLDDVKKVFGTEQLQKLENDIASAEIPFIYFTSLPTSWAPALEELLRILDSRAKPILSAGHQ